MLHLHVVWVNYYSVYTGSEWIHFLPHVDTVVKSICTTVYTVNSQCTWVQVITGIIRSCLVLMTWNWSSRKWSSCCVYKDEQKAKCTNKINKYVIWTFAATSHEFLAVVYSISNMFVCVCKQLFNPHQWIVYVWLASHIDVGIMLTSLGLSYSELVADFFSILPMLPFLSLLCVSFLFELCIPLG